MSLKSLQQEAREEFTRKYLNDHNGNPAWLRGIFLDEKDKIHMMLNAIDDTAARVYAAALDAVESGMPKENTNIPETIGAGQTQEALSVGKDIGWNNCRAEMLALLRTLREGITGNEHAK